MGLRKKTNEEGGQYKKEEGMSTQGKLQAAQMGLELFKSSQGDGGQAGTTDTAAGVGEGALAGAATGGAIGGAHGAAIGAAVGGLTGALKARSNRKAAERAAQAKHFENLADIEQKKAQNMSNAIASMAAQMGASLRR